MIKDGESQSTIWVRVPANASCSLVVRSGEFTASVKELVILRTVHESPSITAAAQKLDVPRNTIRRGLEDVMVRNGFTGLGRRAHPAGAFSKAMELGLLDNTVLTGLQALNWNYSRPSMKKRTAKEFKMKLP